MLWLMVPQPLAGKELFSFVMSVQEVLLLWWSHCGGNIGTCRARSFVLQSLLYDSLCWQWLNTKKSSILHSSSKWYWGFDSSKLECLYCPFCKEARKSTKTRVQCQKGEKKIIHYIYMQTINLLLLAQTHLIHVGLGTLNVRAIFSPQTVHL